MKTSELMIGDLIMYRGEPIMVYEIDDYYERINTEPDGYNAITCVEISEVMPILPTPEILMKNGFEKTLDEDDIECYRYYNRAADGYIKITLYDKGDGSWSVEIVNYDKFNDNEIRYKNEFSFLKIHQLQHALRLCEIDKEIKI